MEKSQSGEGNFFDLNDQFDDTNQPPLEGDMGEFLQPAMPAPVAISPNEGIGELDSEADAAHAAHVSLDNATPFIQIESVAEKKDLLEVRGFFVHSGKGLYDGATRSDEEPRESYFVDVQDYDTLKINRVWGVALEEVIANASRTMNLEAGSRVHLVQQGKQELFTSEINDANEMVNKKTYANAWVCSPDTGPLPSQMAHLMAGINIDKALERIALRFDMGLGDPRLIAWKQGQNRLLKAIGDDPKAVKSWLSEQTFLSANEERVLVETAVALEGFGDSDPARKKHEIDSRLAALRMMSGDTRYDYLMSTAKPHLVEANLSRESQVNAEVAAAIERYVATAVPNVEPEAPQRRAVRSALLQCLDGLSPIQQSDYLAQRWHQLIADLDVGIVDERNSIGKIVDKFAVIDATKMTSSEYQLKLEEKLALAADDKERAQLLKDEAEARKQDTEGAQAILDPLDKLWSRIAQERDVDMTAYYLSLAVGRLAQSVGEAGSALFKTMTTGLGGMGAWRRKGCLDGLDGMHQALAAAKGTPVYQAFEKDPKVVAACGGNPVGEVVANHPEIARTDVAMEHLNAQESASAPAQSAGIAPTGLWSGVLKATHEMADRVSYLKPEHLFKRDGQHDSQWLDSMQQGLRDFAKGVKETLMPEKIREQIEQMIASIMNTIKMLFAMLRAKSVEPVSKSASAPSMEP